MAGRDDEAGRREQVMAVAEQLLLARGSLNITLNDIAEELGVSRSLMYVYFESVPQIIDALFLEQIGRLDAMIRKQRSCHAGFRARTLAISRGYLLHLARHGHLLLMVLRERHQDSPLQPDSSRAFRRVLTAAARDLRTELQLEPRAALVALELLAAIPEALARLVRSGTVDEAVALATCERLLGAALDALAVRGAAGD